MYACEVASVMSDFVTLYTGVHQAPLVNGFSRQEYWSYPALLQGIFLTQGSELHLLTGRRVLYRQHCLVYIYI